MSKYDRLMSQREAAMKKCPEMTKCAEGEAEGPGFFRPLTDAFAWLGISSGGEESGGDVCQKAVCGRKEAVLAAYMRELLERNKQVNLTAITDPAEFVQKHYIDSLLCADSPELRQARRIVDVGTGGGFPGIPLAVAFPDKEFALIDSLHKRIRIIQELCRKLGIQNVTAIHGRAEELARRKELRESFDLCVSRAVANMSTLSEYCLPFVKTGGVFIAYKGPDCDEELRQAAKAIETLGGRVDREERPSMEGFPLDHRLIYVKKEGPTGSKYPRKAGTPSKEPIK